MKKLSVVLESKTIPQVIDKIDKNIVSLIDIDESIVDKLKNIDGCKINKCCGCCMSEPSCCGTICSSDLGCNDQLNWFCSEQDIVNILKTNITVQDMLNIDTQFNKFRFVSGPEDLNILYFKESTNIEVMQQFNVEFTNYSSNKPLYDFINNICETYKLLYPICLTRLDGKIQLFFVKFTGSNGKEGSIKSSLTQIAKMLGDLEKNENITWSQVLDVSIDNADDVYSFVITVMCDQNKFKKINNN